MDWNLPEVDDDQVAAQDAARRKKEAEKAARVSAGVDPAIAVAEGSTGRPVSDLNAEEREERWGFTHDELKSATKVATILFSKPQLYVGDPYLAESRLYTMISRDRKAKRENKDTFKQVMNEEKSRKQQQKRQDDINTMRKTRMKQERDAALNNLLLPPTEDDEPETPLAITDAAEGDETTELRVHRARKCHICKNAYQQLHNFYYSLCAPCGDFNFEKRNQKRDLKGKNVLLTGCRIKIGYEMALSLLRCGATLLGTTRFAHDAVLRFQQEDDYDEWKDRLHLFSLDLRDMWVVTQFCGFLQQKFGSLYAIINNAAQTIARTPEYTARLRQHEANPGVQESSFLSEKETDRSWREFFLNNSSVAVGQPLALDYHPGSNVFLADTSQPPEATTTMSTATSEAAKAALTSPNQPIRYDRYDTVFEQSDQRTTNSWTMNMGEVSGSEASEVMAINALSPFILNAKLKPMMLHRTEGDDPNRFIINVSAMEGQFYRYKQTTHPHTNMAKAALNMMTRTSGADYAKDCIFMNAVDTGWITDESPIQKKMRRGDDFQQCPLDEVDAAARCLDLIYTDSTEHSQFWKDYHPIPW